MRWWTLRLNRKKAEQVRALVEEHGWSPEDLQREKDAMAFKDATDSENPFYVYVRPPSPLSSRSRATHRPRLTFSNASQVC